MLLGPEAMSNSCGGSAEQRLLCLIVVCAPLVHCQGLASSSVLLVMRPLAGAAVYAMLEECGGLAVLHDPLLSVATAEIVATHRSRLEIQRDIKAKERARDTLARR